jgi:hypothetical protein
MSDRELPLAEPGMEAYARRMMIDGIAPDEFAARYAHTIATFSMDNFSYREPEVEAWVHRLGAILWGKAGMPRLAELRARYLTDDERKKIAETEAEQEF